MQKCRMKVREVQYWKYGGKKKGIRAMQMNVTSLVPRGITGKAPYFSNYKPND